MQLYPAEAVFISVAGCGWISFRAYVPYSGYKFRGESKLHIITYTAAGCQKVYPAGQLPLAAAYQALTILPLPWDIVLQQRF